MLQNNIKIFIINLKKDTEKKEYMQKLCIKYNIHAEFIEAVEGVSLSEKGISKIYSEKKSIDTIGRELSRGEIGCALSHKSIYEKIVNKDIEVALILEDDIFFDRKLLDILDLKDSIEDKWDLTLLGHHTGYSREVDTRASAWKQVNLTNKCKLSRPCEKAYGTYGYMLTNKGAKKLLLQLDTIIKPIDHYTGDSKYINLYIVNPAPIRIYEQLSENNNMQKREKLIISESENFSLRNILAKSIRKYDFVNSSKNYIQGLFLSLIPLRDYK